ncbi:MAG: 30S ribosomal protein S12 methylthiotransferase RimO [Candidatus Calescibacterium sp.]|nr:30S ribosomal protein S12 methylthiotransferase RimO [Candidatus Calescibacterium sp.]MDW8132248.1 30S ribosomal protein S12 methylthiotransferase RimO [Candidatus Calescibacterium sp.]
MIRTKNFSVITLGCSKNTVDSELLIASLIDKGYRYSDNILDSSFIIINTCGFIKPAINQSLETIKNVVKTIKDNKVNSKVIVSGCLVSRYKNKIVDDLKDVDAFYDTNSFFQIPFDVEKIRSGKKIFSVSQYTPDYSSKLSKFVSTGYYSYVKIAEGCNHTCSFCAIPLIRGKYKSRTIEDIVSEVKKLVNIGIKEVILVSQDTSFYGYDIYKKLSLDRLLYSLSELDGDFWIRLLYLYPTTLNKSALNVIGQSPKIVKYIDIPLQHVSSNVLKAMRRPGNKDFYKDMIYQIRNIIPDVVIRSTFIVGHPMEEEEDFLELMEFLKEVKIERAGFFKYYREKNTPSYSLPQVDYKTKRKRYSMVTSLQDRILKEWSLKQIGKVFKTLITEENEDYYVGRAYFDAPEVDSSIKISKNKKKKILVGQFYDIQITGFEEYDFYGSCVS